MPEGHQPDMLQSLQSLGCTRCTRDAEHSPWSTDSCFVWRPHLGQDLNRDALELAQRRLTAPQAVCHLRNVFWNPVRVPIDSQQPHMHMTARTGTCKTDQETQ